MLRITGFNSQLCLRMPTTALPFSTGQGTCHGDRGLENVAKGPIDANAWVGLHHSVAVPLLWPQGSQG